MDIAVLSRAFLKRYGIKALFDPKDKLYDKLPLKEFLAKEFALTSPARPDQKFTNDLFMENGSVGELSYTYKNVEIMDNSSGMATYGALLKEQYDNNIFARINVLQKEGLFIYVPPNTTLDNLFIRHSLDDRLQSHSTHPKIQIILGRGASLALSYLISSATKDFWLNTKIDIRLAEDAKLSLVQQSDYLQGYAFQTLRASLAQRASLELRSHMQGCTIFDDTRVLCQRSAQCSLNMLATPTSDDRVNFYTKVSHVAPETLSKQYVVATLEDSSKVNVNGNIYVAKNALLTEAYQKCEALLLSDEATMSTEPNLEIFTDDVKASHGATISGLDAEQLFYLQSRGIAPKKAQDFLIEAFKKRVFA